MILYVESKAFPYRTFVVRVMPHETIARVRAQILHVLYELGREDHQFRLRHKGEYLRDAYTVEDYGIIASSIIKMVPLSRMAESRIDLRSVDGSQSCEASSATGVDGGIRLDVKEALQDEVRVFEHREKLIFHFKGLNYIVFMLMWLGFLSSYWYCGIWTGFVWFIGSYFCPTFTRFSGFIGKQSIYKTEFCLSYGITSLMAMVVAVYLCMTEWARILANGCVNWVFEGDCGYVVVYSAFLFGLMSIVLVVASGIAWAMLWNFKVEYGDFVEKFLVKSRDIDDILKSAKTGGTKEKRAATFELATMAASGDDSKFRIVAEGGLELLIKLALSRDGATQEHSVEAIAELLTVPAIQDNFVEVGGVRTLTALLHSDDQRLVYQAASALSYIVADSEENKFAVIADHGLEDLAYAARHGSLSARRLVAGVYLDLAFNTDVRMEMASLNTPAQALIKLSASPDPDTQRYALQTLELLAIESGEMIRAQDELLTLILDLPNTTVDTKVYTLAGKILLYYAEDRESCEKLLDLAGCQEALFQYARTNDAVLQKVVCKVLYCALDVEELKFRCRHLEMGEVLTYIRDHAADREAWDAADQALQYLMSDDLDMNLPPMSAAEKLEKMDPEVQAEKIKRDFGSRASFGSRISMRSNASSSVDSVVKAKRG